MQVSKNLQATFDLLPDEMIVLTLIQIDVDTLLACRLVCKRWHVLIDEYIFQEKASQQNEFVNNGRGYYSFSEIDQNDIKRLDLPWYVFRTICKHDPFNRNLLQNNCGQEDYNHWLNIKNYVTIEESPQIASILRFPDNSDFDGNTSCFRVLSECTFKQMIRLKSYGLNATVMKKLQPEILFSGWYHFESHQQFLYTLSATVLNRNNISIGYHNYEINKLKMKQHSIWKKVSQTFKNQGNASKLVLCHSVDGLKQRPRHGHYKNIRNSFRISGSVVKILLPIKFKYAADQ